MTDKSITLYHYWRSSCSWRVRWALNYKNVSYVLKAVNLLKGEQAQEKYLNENPSGFVPALVYGNQSFGESMAMIEWIDEKWPENPLLPNDIEEKMIVRQMYMAIACGTQPLQNLIAQKYHSEEKSERLTYTKYWISKGLRTYETLLEKHDSRSYSFGDHLTMADLCLIPQCYNAKRFGVDLNDYPLLKKVDELCLETEACQRAAPENQEGATAV